MNPYQPCSARPCPGMGHLTAPRLAGALHGHPAQAVQLPVRENAVIISSAFGRRRVEFFLGCLFRYTCRFTQPRLVR